jgi:peptidoglycan hydrolase CwlO-like protein
MRKRINALLSLILIALISVAVTSSFTLTSAEPDCDSNNLSGGEIDVCLQKLKHDAEALAPAHENNKKELEALTKQVADLKRRIESTSKQIKNLETSISTREKDLVHTQKIFEQKAAEHYKFLRAYDPLLPFLVADSASQVFLEISLRQRTVEGDRKVMEAYGVDLTKLKNDRDSLAKNKESLAALQKNVDSRAQFMSKEVAKVEGYLADLSSRQEELLAQKAGGFATSIGDTPPTLEPCSGAPGTDSFCDPGFRPAFAGFSFGALPPTPRKNNLPPSSRTLHRIEIIRSIFSTSTFFEISATSFKYLVG